MDVEFLIAIVKNNKMKQNAELKQRALTIEKKLGMMSHYKSIDNTSINKKFSHDKAVVSKSKSFQLINPV